MITVSYDRYRSTTHDFHELGGTPNDEECTPAGGDTNDQKAECKALINQLKRLHGEPPAGCEFCYVRNAHDFGVYYEAGLIYPQASRDLDWDVESGLITQEEADRLEDANDIVWQYINKCEHLPDNWDDEARQELHEAQHPRFHAKIVQLKSA